MRSLAVFCGSSPGFSDDYTKAVVGLATEIARRELLAVYGGASVGAMDTLANTVLSCGGRITGVLPKQLFEKEIAHKSLTDLHVVGSMHERKALIAELSDGFVALPGGFGTLDELAEILTWAQLGIHTKPVAVLNTLGYFDSLIAFMNHAVAEGFLREENRSALIVESDPVALLDAMDAYTPITVSKWMNQAGEELPLP